MVQSLALPVVAFTHEPIGQTQGQYRPRQGGQFGRINVGVKDDELAGQCQDRDQNDGLDLDDAFLTQRHFDDRMLEFHRDQQRHGGTEYQLKSLMIGWIQCIHDE